MDATLQDPLVGRLVDGRYLVESRIARGGMATVYLAVDRRLDREIALKVMYPHLADDDAFVTRFIREARSAARLSHPNVVQVFDQGSDGEVLYLAMEHLPGRTLRDVLVERGVLTPREALTVIEPVLDALGAAHRAGLVHRDVKPENVILTDEGRVKVADFGLARAVTGASAQTGALIGTVAYLSPELVARGIADARSDVYAAGIMLFEMLTGRQPFSGEVPMQVAYQHVHDDIPAPSTLVPELPTPLDDAVLAAVARDPDERPADATEWLRLVRRMHAELDDQALDHRPDVPVPPQAPARPQAAGAATEVLARPAGASSYPTQALAAAGPLASLRERSRRDAEDQRAMGPTPEDVAMEELTRRRRRRGMIGLALVVVLTAVLSFAGWWLTGPGSRMPTPGLVNLTEAEALDKLAKAGLTGARTKDAVYSETISAGSVVSTDPESGREVRKGGTVTYTLSLGTAVRKVPTVTGQTVAKATAALADQQLKATTATQQRYDDDVPKGSVVSTDPAAGTQARVGDTVTLVLSKGPEPIEVPDVRGKNIDEAKGILADKDLEVSVEERYDDEVPAGNVVSQDPDEGETVDRGSRVSLVVSKGPELVEVPDVFGKQFDEARRILREAGFQVRRSNVFGGAFGTVRFQNPGGGEKVPPGTTVTLTVI